MARTTGIKKAGFGEKLGPFSLRCGPGLGIPGEFLGQWVPGPLVRFPKVGYGLSLAQGGEGLNGENGLEKERNFKKLGRTGQGWLALGYGGTGRIGGWINFGASWGF